MLAVSTVRNRKACVWERRLLVSCSVGAGTVIGENVTFTAFNLYTFFIALMTHVAGYSPVLLLLIDVD